MNLSCTLFSNLLYKARSSARTRNYSVIIVAILLRILAQSDCDKRQSLPSPLKLITPKFKITTAATPRTVTDIMQMVSNLEQMFSVEQQ